MTIDIRTDNDLWNLYRRYKAKPGWNLKKLIELILDKSKNIEILFRIGHQFIAEYEIRVPGQFADRVIHDRKKRPHFSAWRTDGRYICVHFGKSKVPVTFEAKAIRSIKNKGYWRALKGRIPLTYLERPRVFSLLMEKKFPGSKFAIVAKKKSIKWIRQRLTNY